jgi:hypothetical protein
MMEALVGTNEIKIRESVYIPALIPSFQDILSDEAISLRRNLRYQ